jgi:hypothetical protein
MTDRQPRRVNVRCRSDGRHRASSFPPHAPACRPDDAASIERGTLIGRWLRSTG